MLDGIVGWPSDPVPRMRAEDGDRGRVDTETPTPPTARPVPPVQQPSVRRIMISKEDIARYGSTEGCRRCRMSERGDEEGYRGSNHSDECRRRMEEKIRGDEGQKHRVERADRRRDEFLAKEVAQGSDGRSPVDQGDASERAERGPVGEERPETVDREPEENVDD